MPKHPRATSTLPYRKPIFQALVTLVARVLGALPRIQALRARSEALPGFDPAHIDELERCALALNHAHIQCRASARPADDLVELNQEATDTRNRLCADASALALRQLIDPASLRAHGGLHGYKIVASDLLLLTTVLRNRWEDIAGKCACTLEEIIRAEKLAARMLRLVGRRRHKPDEEVQWQDRRDRSFTVLIHHYQAVRRAVVYLRWDEGDADLIAPSLYAGRRRKPSKAPAVEAVAAGQAATAATQNAPVFRPPAEPASTGGDINAVACLVPAGKAPSAVPPAGSSYLDNDGAASNDGAPHTRVRVDGLDPPVAGAGPDPGERELAL